MALPKLLLFLVLLALVPLMVFGGIAFTIATSSLDNVEHRQIEDVVVSANRALKNVRNGLVRASNDYANWDEFHDGLNDESLTAEWFDTNYGSGTSSVSSTHQLTALGVWNKDAGLIYKFGT